ncbi:MAG: macro domain-containing protein [Deltaproteobacteria bacterium]|nr:macro domain-containing protein [Deltaproteobacteria bacterium]
MNLRVIVGDITELKVDAIVNAANSYGVMGGGVAGAIKRKGGIVIEKEAVAHAPISIGHAIATSAGSLPCRAVIHAPTMAEPAQITSAEVVAQATEAALVCADRMKFFSLAFPAMGTGVGRVPIEKAAEAMVKIIVSFQASSLREVILVAHDESMAKEFRTAIKKC